jgi:hypothetical protein
MAMVVVFVVASILIYCRVRAPHPSFSSDYVPVQSESFCADDGGKHVSVPLLLCSINLFIFEHSIFRFFSSSLMFYMHMQGHTSSRILIGDYHFYGRGSPVDLTAAANEYRLASDANNPQVSVLGY